MPKTKNRSRSIRPSGRGASIRIVSTNPDGTVETIDHNPHDYRKSSRGSKSLICGELLKRC